MQLHTVCRTVTRNCQPRMKLIDFLTGHVTKDAFAKRMVQAFKDRGYQTVRYDAQQFSIDLGDQESGGVMFLAHFYADYCQAPRLRRRPIPGELVDMRIKGLAEEGSTVPNLEKLLPVIRDLSYAWFCAAQISATLKDVQHHTGDLPIGEGHRVSLVLDSPTQTQQVTDQVLTSLNICFEDGLIQAVKNLRDISPDKWRTIGPGAYVGAWDDTFDCSRILLTDLIYRLELPANPIALIPARGVLLVTSSRSVEGQMAILQAAKEVIEKNSRWTSASMLELKDGTWQTYAPSAPAVLQLQSELFTRIQFCRYDQQKPLLERQLSAQGKDIFVASYFAYEKNNTIFSVATWSDGVEAWLPKTDYLMFVKPGAGETNDIVNVTWDVAFSFLSPWMIEVPDVLPVRFHVDEFPDSEMLEALREHQTVMGE